MVYEAFEHFLQVLGELFLTGVFSGLEENCGRKFKLYKYRFFFPFRRKKCSLFLYFIWPNFSLRRCLSLKGHARIGKIYSSLPVIDILLGKVLFCWSSFVFSSVVSKMTNLLLKSEND